jgi:hypothetical protein
LVSFIFIGLTWSDPVPDRFGFRGFQAVFFVFSLVGALIASLRPSNPIGWMLLGGGLIAGIQSIGDEYSIYALRASPPRPGADIAAWLGEWIWVPILGMTTTFLPLLFPDGRLPSRRWRLVAWIAGGAIVLTAVAFLLVPGPLSQTPSLDSPVGVGGPSARKFLEALGGAGLVLMVVTTAAAAASLVMRFRRAVGDERQQLKWIAFAAVLLAVGFILTAVGYDLALVLTIPLIPIAMAIAVLRYRLYDLDLVINRTLVYGLVTLLLGLVYAAAIFLPQVLFVGVESNNSLLIAASTLAVAALFRPVRRRIQGFIDRRFYRRRYDATRTLEAFSARLRDEVDLNSLTGELLAVVRSTMQPAHVSLWLRLPETAPGEQVGR